MNMKEHILAALREQFDRWEALLGGMAEERITAPQTTSEWSVKDVIAHLWAWQQRSLSGEPPTQPSRGDSADRYTPRCCSKVSAGDHTPRSPRLHPHVERGNQRGTP